VIILPVSWKTYPERRAGTINPDILALLRSFEENLDRYRVEDRGIQEMDGLTSKVFHVPGEHNVWAVWVDIVTRLPVRIELEHPTLGHTLIMTDFGFDPKFDKRQFDRIPPAGYTPSEYTDPLRDETKPAKGFRPRAYTYTTSGSQGPKKVGRLRSSPKSFDLNYVGDGKHLGETEAVILWYRPEGSSTYRIIYGDLRAEQVAPEDLPN